MSYRTYSFTPRSPGFFAQLPPVTGWLIKANVAVALFFWLFRPVGLENLLALSLDGVRHGFLWQPFTYMFIHGGIWHLAFNMFTLYFLGPETERAMGSKHFLAMYLICGLLAGSMTDPPALAFANAIAQSEAPSVAYATVYPLTMILRILCAQLLVLLFM